MGTIIPNLGMLVTAMQDTSLADALFTSTQQRVLALLFGQPDRSFFVTQIMSLAGSGRGAVQRELKRLSESGLVTVRNIATQKHYQANPASPLFRELCGIVQKTVGLNAPIVAALEPLADKIEVAFIYGSVAKGADRSDSDIDLMVVADDIRLEDLFAILAPVEQLLDRPISPTLLSNKEFAKRRKSDGSLVARVLSGPTIALIGSVDAA